MSAHDNIYALGEHFGVLPAYHDFNGQEHITTDATRRAFLAANGVDVSSDEAISQTLNDLRAYKDNRWFPDEIIIAASEPKDLWFGLGATWQVTAWHETTIFAEGLASDFISLPPLSPDVYDLRIEVADRVEHVRILVTPRHLPMLGEIVTNPRVWGITAALYGLNSTRSTGVGDYHDLGALCKVAGDAGAAFVGVNPVHNMGFADRLAISPYSPSHRGFYNTNHIALDDIVGLERSTAAKKILKDKTLSFATTKRQDQIDYAAQRKTHNSALEALYAVFVAEADEQAQADFATYVEVQDSQLERFAKFEALSEIHGSDWREWPQDVQDDTTAPTVREIFHRWLQFVADRQLEKAQRTALDAGMPLGLYLDLAIGSRRDGAESWCEKSAIATGVSIGAPPDHLGPEGQNWNLAAFSPQKLQATGYAPLRLVLAQTMRHAGVIRIDHVLGLNRSFWIPDDGSPGAYIRQPLESLIAIIKIEAHHAKTLVVGEDLGLVPDGFRDQMQSNGFYGYSVLQYEKNPDGSYRRPEHGKTQVLSCFGTHDTPTVRGFETAYDIDCWQELGTYDDATADHLREDRKNDVQALKALSSDQNQDFANAVHATLATAASEMICLQLDDILNLEKAQNLPGTIDEHPNWRRRYAILIEDINDQTGMAYAIDLMRGAGRANKSNREVED